MMKVVKCPSCGSPNVEQIDNDKYQCPYCGETFRINRNFTPQHPNNYTAPRAANNMDDNPGCAMMALCFFFFPLGFIMYPIKKDTQPKCAKTYILCSVAYLAFMAIVAIVEEIKNN